MGRVLALKEETERVQGVYKKHENLCKRGENARMLEQSQDRDENTGRRGESTQGER